MTTAQTILSNHPGPLPISVQYTPESDRPVTIIFSGSLTTGDIAEMPIWFDLKVNGETIGKSSICVSSTIDFHFATVPAMVDTSLPFVVKDDKVQPITIELVAGDTDSLSNKSDFFNVCVIS